jgi:hypothetical protein
MAENETQETTEEVTEAVETQAAATEEAVEETTEAIAEETPAEPEEEEEISYHAVEKEGEITAIWEMQGRKHIRTISARSGEGEKILSLFTSEIHETDAPPIGETSEVAA